MTTTTAPDRRPVWMAVRLALMLGSAAALVVTAATTSYVAGVLAGLLPLATALWDAYFLRERAHGDPHFQRVGRQIAPLDTWVNVAGLAVLALLANLLPYGPRYHLLVTAPAVAALVVIWLSRRLYASGKESHG